MRRCAARCLALFVPEWPHYPHTITRMYYEINYVIEMRTKMRNDEIQTTLSPGYKTLKYARYEI